MHLDNSYFNLELVIMQSDNLPMDANGVNDGVKGVDDYSDFYLVKEHLKTSCSDDSAASLEVSKSKEVDCGLISDF